MSMLNWGVIVLKDGKLLGETKDQNITYTELGDGVGGKLVLNQLNMCFHNDYVGLGKEQKNQYFSTIFYDFSRFCVPLLKKVHYWQYGGITLKTKVIADGMYLTSFKLNNSFYKVISGYDVSLHSWYRKSAKRAIKKALQKNLERSSK